MSENKKGFFGKLVAGLSKTRANIVSGIDSIFSGFSNIDEDFYEELEETLIMGDLGIIRLWQLWTACVPRLKSRKSRNRRIVRSFLSIR